MGDQLCLGKSLRLFPYLLLCLSLVPLSSGTTYDINLKMPASKPNMDEQYLCHAKKVERPGFITDFVPVAQVSRVHHLIVFGCSGDFDPPSEVWDCEMMVCGYETPSILYAWARNAPALRLPDGAGVSIGANSTIDYLVLQMHYNLQFIGDVLDYSGVSLKVTTDVPVFYAGVFLLAADSVESIPPKMPEYAMNMSCLYSGSADVHPFAYRTHAHALGRIITGYRYREGDFHLIGKGNPQWPQWFYPVKQSDTIRHGDTIAAQCIFDSSSRDHVTNIGAHGLDEMCNFYMYYYVSSKHAAIIPSLKSCTDAGEEVIFDKYPQEARIPLPKNEQFEKEAKMIHERFGVTQDAKWLPAGLKLGQVSCVTMDNEGNVIIFHRADRVWDELSFDEENRFRAAGEGPIRTNVLAVVSSRGQLIEEWGAGLFYLPHGAHVDHKGMLWLTDVAMHQVFRYDLKGDNKPQLTLGTALKPGSDKQSFCKPAAVAVASDGSVFIADGYCNSRVVQCTYDGTFTKSFDTSQDSGVHLGPMRVVHDISIDEHSKALLVADRENGRVVMFNQNTGAVLGTMTDAYMTGAVYSVHYCSEGSIIFVLTGQLGSEQKSESRVFVFDASNHLLLYSFKPEKFAFDATHTLTTSKTCSEVYIGLLNTPAIMRMTIVAMGPPVPHPTYPPDIVDQGASLSSLSITAVTKSPYYSTILLGVFGTFAIILIVLVTMMAIRLLWRQRRDDDHSRHPLLKNPKWKKGFQPLNTEDIDGVDYTSDDSEDREDLLYSNKMTTGSDL